MSHETPPQVQPPPGPPPATQPGQPPTQPPAQLMRLEVWGATDKGREREGNEDAVYPHSGSDTFPFKPSPERLTKRGQLLVVADGVGGAQAGAEASRWAIRVAVERYYDMHGADLGADLRSAVEIANTSLFQYLQSTGDPDAGCTMAAVVVHGGVLSVANVGDSRVYLIRDGQVEQQTRDHTLTQQKIDSGLIRPEDAEMDPGRNVLVRSMGARQTVQVDLFPPRQLAPGDVILVCSDGLTDMLGDEEILRLGANGDSLKRVAKRLIDAANRRGGFDNISVVLARVGGAKRPIGLLGRVAPKRWQKGVLAALVACLVVVACGLLGLATATIINAWPRETPTPLAVETSTVAAPTPMPTASVTATVTAGPTSTQDPRATSTLLPTATPTPTPTRIPPTRVPDRDGDGVPDAEDECGDVPGLPEFNGCPDTDGDGIEDRADKCIDRAGLPEYDGCPADDPDGDGVIGEADKCPYKPGPPGNNGCPVEEPKPTPVATNPPPESERENDE